MTQSLRDAIVPFPRIDPSLVPVERSPDDFHFRAGPWSGTVFEISDDDEDGKLADVIGMLDGTNTVEEILAEFEEDDRTDVLQVLYVLQQEEILYEGTGTIERDGVSGYLSATGQFSVEAMERLASSTVTLVGSGRTATFVAADAAEIGVEVAFRHLGEGRRPPGLGDAAVEMLDRDDFDDAVASSDLVVHAADRPHPDALERLNRLVHESGVPLLVGQVAGLDGVVGPTILPGETACYECFRQRRYANVEAPERYRAYEQVVGDAANAPGPNLAGFGHVVAGCLELELLNQLSGGFGFTVGRIVHYDFSDLSVEANDVLRMPRCPVCGSSPEQVDHDRHLSLEAMVEERNRRDDD